MNTYTVTVSFEVLGESAEAAIEQVRVELSAQSLDWFLEDCDETESRYGEDS